MSFELINFSNLIEKSSIILNVIVYFSYYINVVLESRFGLVTHSHCK